MTDTKYIFESVAGINTNTLKDTLKELVLDIAQHIECGDVDLIKDDKGKLVDIVFNDKNEDATLRDEGERSYFNLQGEDTFKYTLWDIEDITSKRSTEAAGQIFDAFTSWVESIPEVLKQEDAQSTKVKEICSKYKNSKIMYSCYSYSDPLRGKVALIGPVIYDKTVIGEECIPLRDEGKTSLYLTSFANDIGLLLLHGTRAFSDSRMNKYFG